MERDPALTALTIATRSAHTVRPSEAFSYPETSPLLLEQSFSLKRQSGAKSFAVAGVSRS
jgi:hypothetical protein